MKKAPSNLEETFISQIIYPVIIAVFGIFPSTLYGQNTSVVIPSFKKDTIVFSGGITATNKGISTIPSSTLGKAATIFNFSFRKNRLNFDPELRFDMEDIKPWSFIFWWRYRLI